MLAAVMMLFAMLPLAGCGEGDEVDNTPDYPVEVGGVKFNGAPSKVVCYSPNICYLAQLVPSCCFVSAIRS